MMTPTQLEKERTLSVKTKLYEDGQPTKEIVIAVIAGHPQPYVCDVNWELLPPKNTKRSVRLRKLGNKTYNDLEIPIGDDGRFKEDLWQTVETCLLDCCLHHTPQKIVWDDSIPNRVPLKLKIEGRNYTDQAILQRHGDNAVVYLTLLSTFRYLCPISYETLNKNEDGSYSAEISRIRP